MPPGRRAAAIGGRSKRSGCSGRATQRARGVGRGRDTVFGFGPDQGAEMRHPVKSFAVAVAVLAGATTAAAATRQALSPWVQGFVKVQAPIVALTHVRVIDGTGAPARGDQTLIISEGKIAAVGNAASVAVPKAAKILDLKGETVIPGLVGMHEHMFYSNGWGIFTEMPISFPLLYLAGGVTTVRTAGTFEPDTDLDIKRRIDSGQMPGPKMHLTGPYLEGAGGW